MSTTPEDNFHRNSRLLIRLIGLVAPLGLLGMITLITIIFFHFHGSYFEVKIPGGPFITIQGSKSLREVLDSEREQDGDSNYYIEMSKYGLYRINEPALQETFNKSAFHEVNDVSLFQGIRSIGTDHENKLINDIRTLASKQEMPFDEPAQKIKVLTSRRVDKGEAAVCSNSYFLRKQIIISLSQYNFDSIINKQLSDPLRVNTSLKCQDSRIVFIHPDIGKNIFGEKGLGSSVSKDAWAQIPKPDWYPVKSVKSLN